MKLKFILFSLFLIPGLVIAQNNSDKSTEIVFLQALNKLETCIRKNPEQITKQRDYIIGLMDKEILKNSALTEKLMKNPERNEAQRNAIQDQLALTAKQNYIKRSFSRLDWDKGSLDAQMALTLTRNFKEIVN